MRIFIVLSLLIYAFALHAQEAEEPPDAYPFQLDADTIENLAEITLPPYGILIFSQNPA